LSWDDYAAVSSLLGTLLTIALSRIVAARRVLPGRMLLVRALSALVGGMLLRRIHRSCGARLLVPEVLCSFVSRELLWSDWSKAECVTIRAEGKRRYLKKRGTIQRLPSAPRVGAALRNKLVIPKNPSGRFCICHGQFPYGVKRVGPSTTFPRRNQKKCPTTALGWKKDWTRPGATAVAGSFGCLQRILNLDSGAACARQVCSDCDHKQH
jgi:hypothetical protein